MKEKITVMFAGNEITVLADESEEYLNELARVLDRRVTEIIVKNNRCTKMDALMLCALDYLDETVKLKAEIQKLKNDSEAD